MRDSDDDAKCRCTWGRIPHIICAHLQPRQEDSCFYEPWADSVFRFQWWPCLGLSPSTGEPFRAPSDERQKWSSSFCAVLCFSVSFLLLLILRKQIWEMISQHQNNPAVPSASRSHVHPGQKRPCLTPPQTRFWNLWEYLNPWDLWTPTSSLLILSNRFFSTLCQGSSQVRSRIPQTPRSYSRRGEKDLWSHTVWPSFPARRKRFPWGDGGERTWRDSSCNGKTISPMSWKSDRLIRSSLSMRNNFLTARSISLQERGPGELSGGPGFEPLKMEQNIFGSKPAMTRRLNKLQPLSNNSFP